MMITLNFIWTVMTITKELFRQPISSGTRLEPGSYEVGDYGINISEEQRVPKIKKKKKLKTAVEKKR